MPVHTRSAQSTECLALTFSSAFIGALSGSGARRREPAHGTSGLPHSAAIFRFPQARMTQIRPKLIRTSIRVRAPRIRQQSARCRGAAQR